ncbi:Gfo/Idh/MocA family protein [Eisenbergiella tayi]|uniref:Inositol 2-dehydrogenase/D-chiro-inositol 3-dehydrogenase n=1 Tax=Eisenbergiella tayi TaxID=1432052 RepID=A0A1E3AB52_9FIRM|nr:Gfo/Idh/MocA family oxidoreductase [Eisenbergiella tayi]ODM05631.1 Inositol 2-dehydrogenase/D-chiro-inositol 3-dehydrogenase [Eisenbergiella tayi]
MKICFIGAGSIGRRHIRNLSKLIPKHDLTIDLFRSGFGTPLDPETQKLIHKTYTNISQMNRDYDIIFITNPTSLHLNTLLQFQNHANAFFIEKPLFSNTCLSPKEIGLNTDKIYYVAAPMRYTALFQYIQTHIDFNQVYSIRCICSSFLPDWRPQTDYRQSYSAHKELGGGVSIDLIHEWDYITYLIGMPQIVYSIIDKISALEINSDDIAIYIAKYKNTTVELHLDYFGRKNIRQMEIYTANDTIICDFLENSISYLSIGDKIIIPEERDDYQSSELEYFLDIYNGLKPNTNDLINAYSVLKLAEGSYENKKEIIVK